MASKGSARTAAPSPCGRASLRQPVLSERGRSRRVRAGVAVNWSRALSCGWRVSLPPVRTESPQGCLAAGYQITSIPPQSRTLLSFETSGAPWIRQLEAMKRSAGSP
jgi:hypothetical protein